MDVHRGTLVSGVVDRLRSGGSLGSDPDPGIEVVVIDLARYHSDAADRPQVLLELRWQPIAAALFHDVQDLRNVHPCRGLWVVDSLGQFLVLAVPAEPVAGVRERIIAVGVEGGDDGVAFNGGLGILQGPAPGDLLHDVLVLFRVLGVHFDADLELLGITRDGEGELGAEERPQIIGRGDPEVFQLALA